MGSATLGKLPTEESRSVSMPGDVVRFRARLGCGIRRSGQAGYGRITTGEAANQMLRKSPYVAYDVHTGVVIMSSGPGPGHGRIAISAAGQPHHHR